MRAGGIIGIPLTLLQLAVHHYTGIPIDGWTVVNNFALANAIYDADRISSEIPLFSRERRLTQLSTIVSTTYYASDEHTTLLAPLVPCLHYGYGSIIKPLISPVKPFFVAFLWTISIYYVPALQHPGVGMLEYFTPSALFLSLASLSHAVDILDVEGDQKNKIITPAVILKDDAIKYAFALAFASALLHSKSASSSFILYDELTILSLIGIIYQRFDFVGAVGIAFLLGYLHDHDLELMSLLLLSTDGFHEKAISFSVDAVRWISTIPDETVREFVTNILFQMIRNGDATGSAILNVYESVVRQRLF